MAREQIPTDHELKIIEERLIDMIKRINGMRDDMGKKPWILIEEPGL